MNQSIYYNIKKFRKIVTCGFFTSKGGTSKGNFHSLNCSKSNKDNKINVSRNIKIALKNLNIDSKKLKLINQIHSNKTYMCRQPTVVLLNPSNTQRHLCISDFFSRGFLICVPKPPTVIPYGQLRYLPAAYRLTPKSAFSKLRPIYSHHSGLKALRPKQEGL